MECWKSSSTSSETGYIWPLHTASSSVPTTVSRKMFECPVCKSGFPTKHGLARHMNLHRHRNTTVTKRWYQCSFCRQGFWNAKALDFHMEWHRSRLLYSLLELQQNMFIKFNTTTTIHIQHLGIGSMALSQPHGCFHVASGRDVYEQVDSGDRPLPSAYLPISSYSLFENQQNMFIDFNTTRNYIQHLGVASMATRRENMVAEGHEIDLELRLGL